MFNPKKEIFAKLKELGIPSTYQSHQNVFSETPAITYRIDGNSTNLDLDNEIYSQEIYVEVSIWSESSSANSDILARVEAKMREINYQLTNAIDVPHQDGTLFHTSCSFRAIKVNKEN